MPTWISKTITDHLKILIHIYFLLGQISGLRETYIHNKANETMMYRFMNVICCKWSSCGNNDTNSKMLLRKKETT